MTASGLSTIAPPASGAASTRGIDPTIVGAIARASVSAHVDFSYLMAQAAQESDFQPNAKASTSSATGLFQFIDSTWLSAVKQYGAKYGLGQYADQITNTPSGPRVSDPAMRQQILSLRDNPTISSEIAAETAQANKQVLAQNLGHAPSTTALYLAHFLGASGATTLVKSVETASSTKGADLLPQAAAANRSVFYDRNTGAARTVAQIYSSFAEKLDTQIANFGGTIGEDSMATLALASAAPATGETAAVGLADLPNRLNQPMMSMMNAVALTALKLAGDNDQNDSLSPAGDRDNRRKNQTQAVAA